MTVYVDNARHRYGRMVMCHMVGTDVQELHLLAQAIGVDRRHFHRGHYNVCLAKRAEAVRLGATEITAREAAGIRRRLESP